MEGNNNDNHPNIHRNYNNNINNHLYEGGGQNGLQGKNQPRQ